MSHCGGIFAVCTPHGSGQEGALDADNWSYVAEKSKGYEKVYTYRFVGEGKGDFDFDSRPASSQEDMQNAHQRFAMLKWGLLCAGAAGVLAVCLVTTMLMITQGADHSAHPSPPPSPSSSSSEQVTPGRPAGSERRSQNLLGSRVTVADDSPRSEPHFDCEAGFESWRSGWSPAKKTYCCKNRARGCEVSAAAGAAAVPGVTGVPAATAATTGSQVVPSDSSQVTQVPAQNTSLLAFNCSAELPEVVKSWSFTQRRWCCLHHHVGCPHSSHTPPSNITLPVPTGQACDALCVLPGLSGSCAQQIRHMASGRTCAAARAEVLRDCPHCSKCAAAEAGCAATTAPPHGGCDELCVLDGLTRSCRTHILTMADSEFSNQSNGCLTASTYVLRHCTGCSRCAPVQAGCASWRPPNASNTSKPHPQAAEEPDPSSKPKDADCDQVWSISKKKWCCKSRGCAPTVDYDCDAGYGNWEEGWSLFKKAWCCQHHFKGCPSKNSKLFDCDEGYSSWQDKWAPGKQAWCCKHAGRGCTTTEPPATI